MDNQIFSVNTLGLVAGIFTTIAFIPQLFKIWVSKSAKDVSIGMFSLFILGVTLWCIYGWEIHSIPVMAANIITFILSTLILILKIIFDSRTKEI